VPIHIDKETRQRVVHDRYCGDLQYDLEGDSVITRESVPVIGPWTDNSPNGQTSGDVSSSTQQHFAGITNQLFGQDAELEGEKLPPLNEVGENAEIYRRRKIRRHIDLGPKC